MIEIKYTAYHSVVLDADPDTVWEQARDLVKMITIGFGDIVKNAHWLKGGSASKVPSVCEFTLIPDNDVVREEVIGRSEHDRSLTYRTVGQAVQFAEYLGSHQVLPVTNEPNRSFFALSSEFTLIQNADPQFLPSLDALMDQEMANVKAHFAT